VSEVVEDFFQVRDETATLPSLYHDVIDIYLKVMPYLLLEAKLHTPLMHSPTFFSPNGIFM
jgi:hypothetical protein